MVGWWAGSWVWPARGRLLLASSQSSAASERETAELQFTNRTSPFSVAQEKKTKRAAQSPCAAIEWLWLVWISRRRKSRGW